MNKLGVLFMILILGACNSDGTTGGGVDVPADVGADIGGPDFVLLDIVGADATPDLGSDRAAPDAQPDLGGPACEPLQTLRDRGGLRVAGGRGRRLRRLRRRGGLLRWTL
jgi:hypothetical protein